MSVVVDSNSQCLRSKNSKPSCSWTCGALRAVDYENRDEEAVDELLESTSRGCSETLSGGEMYRVLVVNSDIEEVRAVVGKYRQAWVVGRVSEAEAVSRAAEIFVQVFVNGGREEGFISEEFMPVGSDGRIVLSFNLLNADPRDWIYDWYGLKSFRFFSLLISNIFGLLL